MTTQAIRPAGAGHETWAVILACAVILLLAMTTIAIRSASLVERAVPADKIDARHGLTAAEQGIYADLLVAADEIGLMPDAPDIEDLGAALIAPFVDDASGARRGEHRWIRLQDGAVIGYMGMTRHPEIAGSLLLRMPLSVTGGQGQSGFAPQVWLNKSAQFANTPFSALDEAKLLHDGWRQIVSHFDAGVTRHLP